MVEHWTTNSDRRENVGQHGWEEQEDGGKLDSKLRQKRESVGQLGEQEQDDVGTLDSKHRQNRVCWVGGTRSRRMVGHWTANLDRRESVEWVGEKEQEDGGTWTAKIERREFMGKVGEQEKEDGAPSSSHGKLDSELRQKRECWIGGRIGVEGWWETRQHTQIQQKRECMGQVREQKQENGGTWTAKIERRECMGQVGEQEQEVGGHWTANIWEELQPAVRQVYFTSCKVSGGNIPTI